MLKGKKFDAFALPRYRLHKSNAMLKHCGGSPKWLEAQSLQGTLQQSFRRIER